MIDSVTLWISNLMLGMGGRLLGDLEILDAVVRAVRAGRGMPRVVRVTNVAESGAVHLRVAGLSIRNK